MHSRTWHAALDRVQHGPVPVVAALHGAVVGGGLELASACHIRVADGTTFYALPEGSRGIFVGGGGSVRIPKLIGVARVALRDVALGAQYLCAEQSLGDYPARITGHITDRLQHWADTAPERTFMAKPGLMRTTPIWD